MSKILGIAGQAIDTITLAFFAAVVIGLAGVAVMSLAVPIGILPALLLMALGCGVVYRTLATAA